jgi:AraC family transcriptional regulator of adaptative response / DNA-3-methyladenine glycosylase II
MTPSLDTDLCYPALRARDRRFDGIFFVGVTSTRIYCRPVCTVRTPLRANCRFFAHAAAAEAAGFRPCLRCRPELAPGQASVDAVEELARAAAARIESGGLDEGESLESLAEDLGVSARHLRRAVQDCFGVSPVMLAQTHRLLTAKRLLTETRLPIIEIALASGFRSLRRFNSLFRARYGLAPTRWRADAKPPAAAAEGLTLTLQYRPPLAWVTMLRYFQRRAIPGVEWITDTAYARTVSLRGHRGWLRVSAVAGTPALQVEIAPTLVPILPAVLTRVRWMFDLDARPEVIGQHFAADPMLHALWQGEPGLRMPGAFDGFEIAVRTILGQQVSVAGATTLMKRLVQAFAAPATTPFVDLHRWPVDPADFAQMPVASLTALGLIRQRAESIVAVARALAGKKLHLTPGVRPAATIAVLLALPGIGPWTAHYLAMRVLRWPDAFPAADLGIRHALGDLGTAAAERRSQAWRPWRAYAVIHLWQSLESSVAPKS